ncbi:hypothetical protein [Nostoc sp.]|uniref:hypothetical protein n=1 Tax=Nostoc sp. TaxID=1180 RepID=UPI002FFAA68B
MNNTQVLETAAIILGSEPTPIAIAYRAEQLEMWRSFRSGGITCVDGVLVKWDE